MKKLYEKAFLLLVIALALITVLFYFVYFLLPPVFSDSYQKGFNYQISALENAPDEPKIIVLGGSYMTFATNSALLSELAERPAYTLGIHSGMGMCYIIETAQKFIRNGDIVVYSFLPGAQAKKNDYGMDLIYLCFEGEKELFQDFFSSHPFVIIKTFAPAIYTKLYNRFVQMIRRFLLHKLNIDKSVYTAAGFDKNTGNMVYPRPAIDPQIPESELLPSRKYEIDDVDVSGIKILNDFYDSCQKNGAKLYITWAPVYEGSVISTEEEKSVYEKYLSEQLSAPIISTLSANELPEDCVYNGALHMNDKGMERYTRQMFKDIEPFL